MNGEQATGWQAGRQAGKRFAPRPAVKSREERETEGGDKLDTHRERQLEPTWGSAKKCNFFLTDGEIAKNDIAKIGARNGMDSCYLVFAFAVYIANNAETAHSR